LKLAHAPAATTHLIFGWVNRLCNLVSTLFQVSLVINVHVHWIAPTYP